MWHAVASERRGHPRPREGERVRRRQVPRHRDARNGGRGRSERSERSPLRGKLLPLRSSAHKNRRGRPFLVDLFFCVSKTENEIRTRDRPRGAVRRMPDWGGVCRGKKLRQKAGVRVSFSARKWMLKSIHFFWGKQNGKRDPNSRPPPRGCQAESLTGGLRRG